MNYIYCLKTPEGKYIRLEKARDLTKLIKKRIVDKNGNIKTVYVKVEEKKDRYRNIKRFIESIRGSKIEHSITVDDEGRLLVHKEGKANQIRFTQQELRKMNGAKLSVHNHPKGGAFSLGDIVFLCKNNIKEIKISNLEFNKKIDYSLKLLRLVGNEEIINIVKEYTKSYNFIFNKFKDEILEGKRTPESASENFSHFFIIDFSNKFKDIFKYERRKK